MKHPLFIFDVQEDKVKYEALKLQHSALFSPCGFYHISALLRKENLNTHTHAVVVFCSQ